MASSAPRLLSADSHVLEPRDLWTSRIEPRFRDRAPRVVDEAGGLRGDIFVCEELRPVAVAGLGVAGVDPLEYPERMLGGYDGVRPSGWDPVARLADQDRDGVSGEVLYTSLGMMLYGLKDGELRAASFRAFNDWLAEFCAHAPGRLAGIGLIPMDDVQLAVAEVERCATMGLRGGMIWGVPPQERRYQQRSWDPLWAAAQAHEMPLSLHILTGADGPGVGSSIMWDYPFLPHALERSFADLIFGGVLQRFDRLKLVSAENDVGWIAHFLQRMDHSYEKYRSLEADPIPEPPSFYFRRQVFATFQEDRVGIQSRADVGVRNMMWASDFPHSDSTWPRSRDIVQRDFADVPARDRDAILWDNCARVYGLG